jgi:hypothetical protein
VRGVLARTRRGDTNEGSEGVSLFIKARAVVVACGALMTPPLLLNSGLKNENIGKYLRVHPASTCWGFFPEGVGPKGRFYEGGIPTSMGGFWRQGCSIPRCLQPSIHGNQVGDVVLIFSRSKLSKEGGGPLSHNRWTRSDFVINGGIKHASIPYKAKKSNGSKKICLLPWACSHKSLHTCGRSTCIGHF